MSDLSLPATTYTTMLQDNPRLKEACRSKIAETKDEYRKTPFILCGSGAKSSDFRELETPAGGNSTTSSPSVVHDGLFAGNSTTTIHALHDGLLTRSQACTYTYTSTSTSTSTRAVHSDLCPCSNSGTKSCCTKPHTSLWSRPPICLITDSSAAQSRANSSKAGVFRMLKTMERGTGHFEHCRNTDAGRRGQNGGSRGGPRRTCTVTPDVVHQSRIDRVGIFLFLTCLGIGMFV